MKWRPGSLGQHGTTGRGWNQVQDPMRARDAKKSSVGRAGKASKSRKSFPGARNIHAGNGHNLSLWQRWEDSERMKEEKCQKHGCFCRKKKVKCSGDGFRL